MNKFIYIILVALISMGLFANWVINKAQSSIDIPVIKEVPSFPLQIKMEKSFLTTISEIK